MFVCFFPFLLNSASCLTCSTACRVFVLALTFQFMDVQLPGDRSKRTPPLLPLAGPTLKRRFYAIINKRLRVFVFKLFRFFRSFASYYLQSKQKQFLITTTEKDVRPQKCPYRHRRPCPRGKSNRETSTDLECSKTLVLKSQTPPFRRERPSSVP